MKLQHADDVRGCVMKTISWLARAHPRTIPGFNSSDMIFHEMVGVKSHIYMFSNKHTSPDVVKLFIFGVWTTTISSAGHAQQTMRKSSNQGFRERGQFTAASGGVVRDQTEKKKMKIAVLGFTISNQTLHRADWRHQMECKLVVTS